MSYTKQTWTDFPDTSSPITADRLNHMENGIDDANKQITNSYSSSTTNSYSCAYENGLRTYSTTEKRIGTWIDNKPLYSKVIYDTTSRSAGNYNISHGITNYNEIISYKVMCYQSSTTIHDGSSTSALSGSERITSYFNDTNISIRTSWAIVKTIIIIEYTKTTD